MMSTLRTSALGALAIAALAASAGASAQVSPGWYASVGAYSSEINDANGTTTPTVISLAPDVITPGQACLLGPATGAIPELGGALEGLGGTLAGDTGCLLGLIGPGADDDIQPGQQVESQGQAQPIGVIFDGGFGINTAIGYQFIGGLRPELTLALSTNDFKVITSSAELADQRNNVGGKLEATRVGASCGSTSRSASACCPIWAQGWASRAPRRPSTAPARTPTPAVSFRPAQASAIC